MGRNECGANSPGPIPATNTVDVVTYYLVLDPVLKSTGTVTSLALAWPGMGTATATPTATATATTDDGYRLWLCHCIVIELFIS